jgi:hypothetical protein
MQMRLQQLPIQQWTSADVSAWIVSIGMEQYKKHFVHHAVDGQLLLELNIDLMRSELKILPLGHRNAILAQRNSCRDSHAEKLDDSIARVHIGSGVPSTFSSVTTTSPGLHQCFMRSTITTLISVGAPLQSV